MSVTLRNGAYEISPISVKDFLKSRKFHLVLAGTVVAQLAAAVCAFVLPHPIGWGIVAGLAIVALIAIAYTFYHWKQEQENAAAARIQAHSQPSAAAQPPAAAPAAQPLPAAATAPQRPTSRRRPSPSTQPSKAPGPGVAQRAARWAWRNTKPLAVAGATAAAGYAAYSTGPLAAAAAGISQAAGYAGAALNALVAAIPSGGAVAEAVPAAAGWGSSLFSVFSAAALLANGVRLFRQERRESP